MAEPRIIVSETEWRKEIGKIGAVVRERKKAEREWGRYASLWRWRRRREDYERLVAAIRRRWELIREERALRRILARKVRWPYWRVGVAYMFRKETKIPPYIFYAEFRKTVYTRHPEKYAEYDPKTHEWISPKPWLEEELREIMFASSVISRVRRDGTIAHGEWIDALSKIKVFPFPDFECSAIDEKEVEAPLDEQQYYVRIQKSEKEVYEYHTKDVEEWLRAYRRWLATMHEAGVIRYPEAYRRKIRQTSIDEFVEWYEKLKESRRRKREGKR